MARSWRFESGRVRATARIGYDYLRSWVQPVRQVEPPGGRHAAPPVAIDLGAGLPTRLPGRLRLLSWNIHRGYDARGVVASLRAVIADHDPNLLLLQEVPVYPHGPWWSAPNVRELLGEMHVIFAPMHRVARPTAYYPFQESGLLVGLRALPEGHRTVRLPVASHPKLGRNHRIERVALEVRCRAGALAAEIWNVHFENTARPSARARQATALAAELGDGPLIVGGDFNTIFGPLEGVTAALEASGLQRVVPRRQRRMSPSIDHIFVRGATSAWGEVLRVSGSDHLPIYAEIELAGRLPDST